MQKSSRIARALLLAGGVVSTAIGVIGIFLPVLPTTPFLLLAAFCFVNSSEKFYNWLVNNRHIGSYIRNFREGKGVSLRAKAVSIALLWLAMGYSLFAMKSLPLRVMLAVIGAGVTIHLLRMKTLRE